MVTSIAEYLESLPEPVLARLFKSPASCLAILRLLPSLAKIIVLQMVFLNEAVPLSRIQAMVKPSWRRKEAEALQKLRHLHLIRERYAQGTIMLTPAFGLSLRCALTSGEPNKAFGILSEKRVETTQDLASWSRSKWEQMLRYMVGSTQGSFPAKLSHGVLELLQKSGLMTGISLERMHISSEGFQFLLQDKRSQVWTLLLHYLSASVNMQLDPVDILNFVFMLGSLELFRAYSISHLGTPQIRMLENLADLGFVYLKEDQELFYPVAAELSADAVQEASGGDQGFIILETNYRLYAYTDSPLHLSILGLFCHLRARFNNMVIGHLTRRSVRAALGLGITADQLVEYLSHNAHPEMRRNKELGDPVLPPTISDQIKLWQLEMDRLKANDGFLFRDFHGAQEYNLVANFASDMGALLWRSDQRRMFFVDRSSSQQVLDYINRKMQG